jgi:molecular chaperone GrpE
MPDESKLHDLKNKSRSHGSYRRAHGSGATQINPNQGQNKEQFQDHTQNPEDHGNNSPTQENSQEGAQQNTDFDDSQTTQTVESAASQASRQPNQSAQPNTPQSTEMDSIKQNSLQVELEDWKNKSLRLAADLQNLTRQHDLDLQQTRKSTKRQTVLSLLTFLNTLNLAFSFAPKTEDEQVSKFIDTLKLSFQQVITELKNQQIEILVPVTGEPFNPDWMNLLSPAQDSEDSLQIKQVVGLGLRVDGQLVQPASVLV